MAESAVITSDMEGSQEFESQSLEELGAELPRQGEAKPAGETQRTGNERTGNEDGTAGARASGEKGAGSEALEAKPTDSLKQILDKIEALESVTKNINRESLAFRMLQSRLDKLEKAATEKGSAPKTAASPEEEQLQAQQEAADKFIRERAQEENKKGLAEFEKKYEFILKPLKDQLLHTDLKKACSDAKLPWEEMDPLIGKIISEDDAAAKAGDQGAVARMSKLLADRDITSVMYRALLARASQIQSKGAEVQKVEAKTAAKGGRMVSTTNNRQSQQATSKKLEDMSPEEIENLAETDLDALGKMLPKQRR